MYCSMFVVGVTVLRYCRKKFVHLFLNSEESYYRWVLLTSVLRIMVKKAFNASTISSKILILK
jgi:hypothetical protein